MHLFGSVIHISKEGIPIARCNSILSLENAQKLLFKPLFSDKQRKIGEVQEIFGPVKGPYLSIHPKHGLKVENLVSNPIYVETQNHGI